VKKLFSDYYRYRFFFTNLVKRALKLKYGRSFLGVLWSLVKPAAYILLYYFAFGKVLKVNEDYFFLFVSVGVIVWLFISSSILQSARELRNNLELMKKIYFPREMLIYATITTFLFEFVLTIMLLVAVAMGFGANLRLVDATTVMLAILTLTAFISWISLIVGQLCVFYHDIAHLTEVLINLFFWLNPIFYPLRLVPQEIFFVYQFNPVVYVIEAMRGVFIPGYSSEIDHLQVNLALQFMVHTVLLIAAILILKKSEPRIAEYV